LPANWKFYSQSLEVCYSNTTFYLTVEYFAVASIVWTCSKNGRGKMAKRSDEMASTRKKKMR